MYLRACVRACMYICLSAQWDETKIHSHMSCGATATHTRVGFFHIQEVRLQLKETIEAMNYKHFFLSKRNFKEREKVKKVS